MGETGPEVQLALCVRAGDASPGLVQGLRELLAEVGGGPAQPVTIGEASFHRLDLPDMPMPLVIGAHADHALICLGTTAAGRMVQRLSGKGTSLGEDSGFAAGRKQLAALRVCVHLYTLASDRERARIEATIECLRQNISRSSEGCHGIESIAEL